MIAGAILIGLVVIMNLAPSSDETSITGNIVYTETVSKSVTTETNQPKSIAVIGTSANKEFTSTASGIDTFLEFDSVQLNETTWNLEFEFPEPVRNVLNTCINVDIENQDQCFSESIFSGVDFSKSIQHLRNDGLRNYPIQATHSGVEINKNYLDLSTGSDTAQLHFPNGWIEGLGFSVGFGTVNYTTNFTLFAINSIDSTTWVNISKIEPSQLEPNSQYLIYASWALATNDSAAGGRCDFDIINDTGASMFPVTGLIEPPGSVNDVKQVTYARKIKTSQTPGAIYTTFKSSDNTANCTSVNGQLVALNLEAMNSGDWYYNESFGDNAIETTETQISRFSIANADSQNDWLMIGTVFVDVDTAVAGWNQNFFNDTHGIMNMSVEGEDALEEYPMTIFSVANDLPPGVDMSHRVSAVSANTDFDLRQEFFFMLNLDAFTGHNSTYVDTNIDPTDIQWTEINELKYNPGNSDPFLVFSNFILDINGDGTGVDPYDDIQMDGVTTPIDWNYTASTLRSKTVHDADEEWSNPIVINGTANAAGRTIVHRVFVGTHAVLIDEVAMAIFSTVLKPGPTIDFFDPTDADGTSVLKNHTYINLSITNSTTIDSVGIEWNGTNITLYRGDLLLNLRMDNNTNDSSGYNHHGSPEGGVQCSLDINGKFGTGCSFDNTNDVIRIDGSGVAGHPLDFTSGNFTFMGWVNNTDNSGTFIGKRDDTAIQYGWYVNTNSHRFIDGSGTNVGADTALANNQLYHLAAVLEPNGTVTFYHNGLPDGNPSTVLTMDHEDVDLAIGARWDSDPTTAFQYGGTLDDIRIYNRPLSATEIALYYRTSIGKYYANITENSYDPYGNYSYYGWVNTTAGAFNRTGTRNLLMYTTSIFNCATLDVEGKTYELASDVYSTGTCFTIAANNITLDGKGHTINYSYSTDGHGVTITGYNNLTVKNVNIVQGTRDVDNSNGINIQTSNYTQIINSTVTILGTTSPENKNSIEIGTKSSYTTVRNSTVNTDCRACYAIEITGTNNFILNNTLYTDNDAHFAYSLLINGNYNTIRNNNFSTTYSTSRNVYFFENGHYNIFANNTLSSSGDEPVNMQDSTYNNLTDNIIIKIGNADDTIQINRESSYNIITRNEIRNEILGSNTIHIDTAGGRTPSNNSIYDNVINVSGGLWIAYTPAVELNNFSLISITPGTNFIGGSNRGGNFYANSSGDGFSQVCVDKNFDNICDGNFTHQNKNTDFYPLAIIQSDNIAPNVSIINPIANNNISGNFYVNVSANDTVAVTGVNLTIYNNTGNATSHIIMSLYSGNGPNGYWNATFDSSALRDGIYNLSVNATDILSNYALSTNTSIVVDNTNAKVTAIVPANDSTIIGSLLINTSVNDTPTGILNSTFRLTNSDGSTVTSWIYTNLNSGNINNGYWNATFDTTSVSDGKYNITINATDFAGNQYLVNISQVQIENIPCGVLSTKGKTYDMTMDVSASGTCYTIAADNITLDGNGYTITYSTGSIGSGIEADSYENLTFKNLILSQTGTVSGLPIAINLTKSNFSTLFNITSNRADGYSIQLAQVQNVTIRNSTINVIASSMDSGIIINYGSKNIDIENSTIVTAGTFGTGGIQFANSANVTVINNILSGSNSGGDGRHTIYSDSGPNYDIIIINNSFVNASSTSAIKLTATGLIFQDSFIIGNTFNVDGTAINLEGSNILRITIANNTINSDLALELDRPGCCDAPPSVIFFENNTVNDTDGNDALRLKGDSITVRGNVITYGGILIEPDSADNNPEVENIIIHNNTINGTYGINLTKALRTNISNNTITTSSYGIGINTDSANNTIFNNLINVSSGLHANIEPSIHVNYWNTSLQTATNIVGGSSVGGNFYADYVGTGYSQTCLDADANSICDTALIHNENNTDFITLSDEFFMPINITINIPVANTQISGSFLINVSTNGTTAVAAVNLTFSNNTGNATYLLPLSLGSGTTSNGYWNLTFDSTTLLDGTYNLSATANNTGGVSKTSGNVSITIDNSNPQLAAIAPLNNTNLSTDFLINASVNDTTTGVLNATFRLTNIIFTSAWLYSELSTGTINTGYWNTTADISNINDGNYNITLNATDFAGNQLLVNISHITIDRQAPNGTIITPANLSTVSSSVILNVSVNDSITLVNSVTFQFFSPQGTISSIVSATLGSGNLNYGYWNYTFDTTTLSDGNYNITLNATDYAGNQLITNKSEVTINNLAPNISVLTPLNFANVSSTILLNVSANETHGISRVNYTIYNNTANATPQTSLSLGTGTNQIGTWNATKDTSELIDGKYNISVLATDLAGTTTSTNTTIVIDNSVPLVVVIVPFNNTNLSNNFLVNASVNDTTSGIFNATFRLMNNLYTLNWLYAQLSTGTIIAGYWNTTVDISGISDAKYNITLNATDYTGNQIIVNISTITVDTTAANTSAISPATGSVQNSNILVNISINDSTSETSTAVFRFVNNDGLHDSGWQSLTIGVGNSAVGYWNYTYDSTLLADGNYNLTVNATDYTANQNIANLSEITIDNNGANASIIVPPTNANLTGTLLVNVSVNETGGSVSDVTLTIYNNTGNATSTISLSLGSGTTNVGYWNSTIDSTTFEDGNYNLSITALTSLGRQTLSQNISITLDQTNPTTTIITPANASTFTGNFLINASVNDTTSGILNTTFRLINELYTTEWLYSQLNSGTIYNGYWNTTVLSSTQPDGTYNITTNATDFTGNSYLVNISHLTIDTTAPNVSIIVPLNGSTITGIILFNASANDSTTGVMSVSFRLTNSSYQSPWNYSTFETGNIYEGYWNVTINVSLFAQTKYNITVNATDTAGNSFVSNLSTIIVTDPSDPIINYGLNSDPDNAFVNRNWIFLNFSYIEENNDTFIIRNLSTNWTNVNASTTYFYYNFTNLNEQNYSFYGWMNDSGARIGQTTNRSITVDITSPVINSLILTSNASGNFWVGSNTTSAATVYVNTIQGSPNGLGGGGAQVATISVGYLDVYPSSTEGNLTFGDTPSNTTANLPQSIAYSIETGSVNSSALITSTDAASNTDTATISFVLDINDTLTSDNTSSDNRYWYSSNVTINLSSTDAQSGVNRTYFCIYTPGTPQCTPAENEYTTATVGDAHLMNLNCSSEGTCQLRVRYYSMDNVSNNESGGENGGAILESNTVNIVTGCASINNTEANNSGITGCADVSHSNISNSNVDGCLVWNSDMQRSNAVKNSSLPTNCTISHSIVLDTNITSSVIDHSFVDPSTFYDTTVIYSNLTNATAYFSRIENSTTCAPGFYFYEAVVRNDTLQSGTITYNGTTYFAPYAFSNICTNLAPSPIGTLSVNQTAYNDGGTILFTYNSVQVGRTITIREIWRIDNSSTTIISLNDNGTSPDDIASDGVHKAIYSIKAQNNISDGPYNLNANVSDNLGNAWQVPVTITLDNTPPNVSIIIVGANASSETTTSQSTTLQISANGSSTCRYANEDQLFGSWEDCSTRAWVLSSGTGLKTVLIEAKDIAGNTVAANDTITYNPTTSSNDTSAPFTPDVRDDGKYTNTDVSLHATWNSSDPDAEVLHQNLQYEYRIGFNGSTNPNIFGYLNTTFTNVGSSTQITLHQLNLTDGNNYTFEIRAINPAGLRSAIGYSDGIIVDISPPEAVTLNSSHLPGNWSSNTLASFNWTSQDSISNISAYSYTIDKSNGTIPDDTVELETEHQMLASGFNGALQTELKYNLSGATSAVFVEVKNNLTPGDVLRLGISLAESHIETTDLSSVRAYAINQVPTTFDMSASNISEILVATRDISYTSNLQDAQKIYLTLQVNSNVSTGSFYVAVSGVASDSNNYNLLLASSNSYDSSRQSQICISGGSCTNTSNSTGYAIDVQLRDQRADEIWDKQYTLGDGTFYFHVKAKDNAGNFGPVLHQQVLVDNSKPSTPQMIIPSQSTSNITQVTFNWTTSTDIESGVGNYSLQVDNDSDFSSPEFYSWLGNITGRTVTGLSTDSVYFGRVHSKNGAGINSSWSGTLALTIDSTAPIIQLSKPRGLVNKQDVVIFLKTNEKAICSGREGVAAYAEFSYTNSTFHETGARLSTSSGATTYDVKCSDAVNNEASATLSITVDVTATVSSITVRNPVAYTNEIVETNISILNSGSTGIGEILKSEITFKVNGNEVPYSYFDVGGGNYSLRFLTPEKNGSYSISAQKGSIIGQSTVSVHNLLLKVQYVDASISASNTQNIIYSAYGNHSIGFGADSSNTETSSNAGGINISANAQDGEVFIFITRSSGSIEKANDRLRNKKFLTLANPSFGYPVEAEEFTVFSDLEYGDIALFGNKTLQNGRYKLIIENKGFDSSINKTKLEVRTG